LDMINKLYFDMNNVFLWGSLNSNLLLHSNILAKYNLYIFQKIHVDWNLGIYIYFHYNCKYVIIHIEHIVLLKIPNKMVDYSLYIYCLSSYKAYLMGIYIFWFNHHKQKFLGRFRISILFSSKNMVNYKIHIFHFVDMVYKLGINKYERYCYIFHLLDKLDISFLIYQNVNSMDMNNIHCSWIMEHFQDNKRRLLSFYRKFDSLGIGDILFDSSPNN
jgi:hypothetical protein